MVVREEFRAVREEGGVPAVLGAKENNPVMALLEQLTPKLMPLLVYAQLYESAGCQCSAASCCHLRYGKDLAMRGAG